MICWFSSQIFNVQRRCLCRCHVTRNIVSSGHPSQGQIFSESTRKISLNSAALSFALLFRNQHPRPCTVALITVRSYSCNSNPNHTTQGKQRTVDNTEKAKEMSNPVISAKLKTVKAETVWGLFAADAVAMPVHWYYNPRDIKKDYGDWLTGYVAPKGKHPSSILKLSAVDGSGRGSTASENSLIGNVILHDKLKYWTGGSTNNHYHQGMAVGDNTLNAVMALQELKAMNRFDLTRPDREVRGAVLEEYVKFMTTPGTHNDTYAESFHRSFFRDWVAKGKPTSPNELLEFSEQRSKKMMQERPDHQLAVIGSLVPAIPWVVRNAHKSEMESVQSTVDFIKLTHPVPALIPYVECYSRLLHSVINGRDLKSEIMNVLGHSILGGPSNRDMMVTVLDALVKLPKHSEEKLKQCQSVIATLGSACYIEGALNSMLFLALEFHDDFEAGILANANCGGENCHRGAALGALLAAAAANKQAAVPGKFKDNLHSLRAEVMEAVQNMNK